MSPNTDATDGSTTLESATPDLVSVTVENDDAPDECAIFPDDASEDELMTNWISAQSDSFVALESMR
ncbi:DUF7511 domain-containing protein [Natronolimnobius baerhuensis]|uniref:DUF7511 domain-containing protein n=1 Tax=Natronolimnobius baerhuensis TaxID=253108 RepID=A0A202E9C1_9EURY|nr:hypothetical protein [Natronolimnobius baerhuensis]OVE84873.1 hypothetical protein B2G88_10910 [Natronolimnobius baerhuensis]